MKALLLLTTILVSVSAFSKGIRPGNFYPKNSAKCGWHVEVDGKMIVLESVYSRTKLCSEYVVLVGECNYRTNTCYFEQTDEKAIFLRDGNMIFTSYYGTNYKNYPYIR